jgi:hypothetical protein
MLAHAAIVANVFSGPLPPSTEQWIIDNFAFGLRKMTAKQVPLHAARNSMIRDVMLPLLDQNADLDWCCFLDNDVTITHPGIERFLAIDGDVVSCECEMPTPNAWAEEESYHDHFWKCRPAVLRAIRPPWFDLNLSADGCDLLGCDCMTFAAKVRAAGFTIKHGGYCGHANAGTWRHQHG